MIDRVQAALEKLAPELENYKQRNLFSDKEISVIVETRRRFETKLQRTQKKLEDFLNYVASERRLERIRNKRIDKADAVPAETDALLADNVISIYQRALYHFSEPVLVRDFACYCVKRKSYERLKEVLLAKCLKNLRDTDLWIFAAQKLWEINDIDGARNVFLKCIGVNSDTRLLVEFFRLECLYAERLNQINDELGIEEDEKSGIEKGDVALAVFRGLIPKIGQAQYQECLEIAACVKGLPEALAVLYEEGKDASE
ncbi:U3 small nucleolar RNA-associated protein 6 [Pancytospora philotis]|nr:U3 small nucleolar RNA-associated protein 6 [Pancytospora philotis]